VRILSKEKVSKSYSLNMAPNLFYYNKYLNICLPTPHQFYGSLFTGQPNPIFAMEILIPSLIVVLHFFITTNRVLFFYLPQHYDGDS